MGQYMPYHSATPRPSYRFSGDSHRLSTTDSVATDSAMHSGFLREAVGYFNNIKALENAVAELEQTAFPRDSISVIGTQHALEQKFGTNRIPPYLLEDDPETPRMAPIRTEERAIGTGVVIGSGLYLGAAGAAIAAGASASPVALLMVILGGAAGAGLGFVMARLLGRFRRRGMETQMANGGLLLWVQTPEDWQEDLACAILKRHNAHHVKVHDITV